MPGDDPRDFPNPRKGADPVPSKDQDGDRPEVTKDQDGDRPEVTKDQDGDRPEVTHDLLLADGTCVESSGGIPTHVAVGDRTIPVLSVTERQ
jgi:hypothetical protein